MFTSSMFTIDESCDTMLSLKKTVNEIKMSVSLHMFVWNHNQQVTLWRNCDGDTIFITRRCIECVYKRNNKQIAEWKVIMATCMKTYSDKPYICPRAEKRPNIFEMPEIVKDTDYITTSSC